VPRGAETAGRPKAAELVWEDKEAVKEPKPSRGRKLNAAAYRRWARETRAAAYSAPKPLIRQGLLDIAERYDRLAELAEAWDRDHQNG
jgi:hypothetical protein